MTGTVALFAIEWEASGPLPGVDYAKGLSVHDSLEAAQLFPPTDIREADCLFSAMALLDSIKDAVNELSSFPAAEHQARALLSEIFQTTDLPENIKPDKNTRPEGRKLSLAAAPKKGEIIRIELPSSCRIVKLFKKLRKTGSQKSFFIGSATLDRFLASTYAHAPPFTPTPGKPVTLKNRDPR